MDLVASGHFEIFPFFVKTSQSVKLSISHRCPDIPWCSIFLILDASNATPLSLSQTAESGAHEFSQSLHTVRCGL